MLHPGLNDDEAAAPGPSREAEAIRRTWQVTGFPGAGDRLLGPRRS